MFFRTFILPLPLHPNRMRAAALNAGTVSLRKSKQRVDDRSRFYARTSERTLYESRRSVSTTSVVSTQDVWRWPLRCARFRPTVRLAIEGGLRRNVDIGNEVGDSSVKNSVPTFHAHH